jgi:uncharacterized protein YggU (UPF0235/DUF167 family)
MKLKVIAHPNSKQPRIEERDGVFHVYVNVVPEDGLANIAIAEALAEHFGVPRFEVELKSGHTAQIKLYEIHDVD